MYSMFYIWNYMIKRRVCVCVSEDLKCKSIVGLFHWCSDVLNFGIAKRRARLPDSVSVCAMPGRRWALGPIFVRLDLIESEASKRPDFPRRRKSVAAHPCSKWRSGLRLIRQVTRPWFRRSWATWASLSPGCEWNVSRWKRSAFFLFSGVGQSRASPTSWRRDATVPSWRCQSSRGVETVLAVEFGAVSDPC